MLDIIIIGGGLAGTSLAYYLAKAGVKPLVIEAKTIGGGGATAASRGIVRVYDPVPQIMQYALDGVDEWRQWQNKSDNLFTQCGCLYLLQDNDRQKMEQALSGHDQNRYPIELIQGNDIIKVASYLPFHAISSQQLALWEPQGGYINTRFSAQFMMNSAKTLGATALESVNVDKLNQLDNGIEVVTGDTRLQAKMVVVATGAAINTLLPQQPHFCRTIPLSAIHDNQSVTPYSCVIDEVSKSYFRPEAPQFYFAGGAEQIDASNINDLPAVTDEQYQQNLTLSRQRLAPNTNAILDGINGFDGYTEDFLPLLTVPNAAQPIGVLGAFSGRGAKYIPGLTKRFAQQIIDQSDFDLKPHKSNTSHTQSEAAS